MAICFVLLPSYRVTIGLVLSASSPKTPLAARGEAGSGRHGLYKVDCALLPAAMRPYVQPPSDAGHALADIAQGP